MQRRNFQYFRIDEGIAAEFGMQTSAIYSVIHELNEAGEKPRVADLCERFPYLTINQIKHSLRMLESHGAVRSEVPGASRLKMAKCYEAVR